MQINKTKLEIAMANKGFNFLGLSKEAKVSRATLSYINNGKNCRADIVYRIAQALNVDATELIEV